MGGQALPITEFVKRYGLSVGDSLPDISQTRADQITARYELVTRHEVTSTNDVAWDVVGQGAADGTVVIADVQTHGRGRQGRNWHTPDDAGLALSMALHPGCDAQALAAVPLAVGLAVARGVASLGAKPALKWPNDVLLGGRKVSGILCEAKRTPLGEDVIIIGIGVNVQQSGDDFPEDVRSIATSLRIAGIDTDRESVAAVTLNAFEPLWVELEEAGAAGVLAAWQSHATFWGDALTVRTPGGEVSGVARELSAEGGLVLELDNGERTTVLAGDVGVRA